MKVIRLRKDTPYAFFIYSLNEKGTVLATFEVDTADPSVYEGLRLLGWTPPNNMKVPSAEEIQETQAQGDACQTLQEGPH